MVNFRKIRDYFWSYPTSIFGPGGSLDSTFNFYNLFNPFGHIIIWSLIFITFGVVNALGYFEIVTEERSKIIEGVIVGESRVTRINPLIPTNNQLENDLVRLIYHPLIRVASNGDVLGVLSDSWEQTDEEGLEYLFSLREDVFWHDGEKFTVDDVIATFAVLKTLGDDESQVVYSKSADLANKMTITKVDNYTLKCTLDSLTPTFYEDFEIGILPKHILDEVSIATFRRSDFNLNPIGTGPFILRSYEGMTMSFVSNKTYFEGSPKFDELIIKMYSTGDDAVLALKNGLIHILVDPSNAILESLEGWNSFQLHSSVSLYRRYFAMYFNLRDNGPEVFRDEKLREAINYGIDVKSIVEQVPSAGEKVTGPIPKISWAYNENPPDYSYDFEKASEILKNEGWEKTRIAGKQVLKKDDHIFKFSLAFLDKPDRFTVASNIKKDLEKLGIVVNLDPYSSYDLNTALIATRNFEAVIYGVETSIDPDRIRLWHSDAIEYPGLNISSFETKEIGTVIGEDKKLVRRSLLNMALENGRSTLDREERKGKGEKDVGYDKFQEIIMDESPVVFLYHPTFSYLVRKRVHGIDLSYMTIPEDRYLSIMNWYIE